MSMRPENVQVANGMRLSRRIVTMRNPKNIPAVVFRRKVLPAPNGNSDRHIDSWGGLGSIADSDEHAIDYEKLGHAMAIIVDSVGGTLHDNGTLIVPENFSAIAHIEPYDINIKDNDERLKTMPNWTLRKTDLVCLLLNGYKDFYEITGTMAMGKLPQAGVRYLLAQRFDLYFLDALDEKNIDDVRVPYE